MKLNIEFVATLLAIKEVESFRNAYSLTKILAWKFKIIEFGDFIKKMTTDRLIEERTVNSIENYEITNEGRIYLHRYKEDAKPLLLKKYPDQEEFINALFYPPLLE